MDLLGLVLDDDDLFHFQKERKCKVTIEEPYTAKLCPPLWFHSVDLSSVTSTEAQTILKFQGDVAYQEERYKAALEAYQQCQNHLQANNVSMRRGVEEDKARCYLHLEQLENAISSADSVSEMAQNFEQVTDVLQLYLDIYRAASIPSKILSTLKKLLLLHPNNSDFWIQLGDLYFACIPLNSDKNPESVESHKVHNGTNSAFEIKDVSSANEQKSLDFKRNNLLDFTDRISAERFTKVLSEVCACCNSELKLHPSFKTLKPNNAAVRCNCSSCDQSSHDKVCFKVFNVTACCICYTAASLLLKSVYHRQNSFAKSRNKTMQMQVNSKMNVLQMHGIEDLQTECSVFLTVALNLSEDVVAEDVVAQVTTEDMTPRQILCNDEKCEEVFTQKWFSWITENNLFTGDQPRQLNNTSEHSHSPQKISD